MKVVVAFDSFKGCISAEEACCAAAEAIRNEWHDAEVVAIPLSDGGEGLVDCVSKMMNVTKVSFKAHGPLMEIIDATYALSSDGKKAYMEMAATSGLTLVPHDKRNPLLTTTYGVGEMIADAIKRGCTEIVMGIGGSATCDGGKGMIQALIDANLLSPTLSNPASFSNPTSPTFNSLSVNITVACDVSNPLYGENGAAYIFGPQKGASTEDVKVLDDRLRTFARETENAGIATPQLANYPGAGAAGGLGYGLMAYLGAELKSGIDIILDITHFDERINDADLVITGEGKSDAQTLMGKVPHGVLKRCKAKSIPVWLLSGAIDDSNGELQKNFDFISSINEGDDRPLNILMQRDVAKENMKNRLVSLKKISIT